jgi:SAM-dependent methyltransferase
MNSELYRRMAAVEREHWWYQGRNAIICQFLRGLGLPQNARILDVGCGTGALTERLSEFGQVVACDPSEFALEQIRRSSGLIAIQPEEIAAQPQWIGSFDVIGFFDVLEHAESDVSLLEQYLPYLRPDGCIVAAVPAWKIFWGDHDVAARHFRRYRLATLATAFKAIGFDLDRWTYFNLLLAPLVLLVRISKRVSAVSSECGDLALPPRLLNTMLKQIFLFERHLLRVVRLPFGVSLLAAFRRRSRDDS